jgi:hypothetical protein
MSCISPATDGEDWTEVLLRRWGVLTQRRGIGGQASNIEVWFPAEQRMFLHHRNVAHGSIATEMGCPPHVCFPPDSDR